MIKNYCYFVAEYFDGRCSDVDESFDYGDDINDEDVCYFNILTIMVFGVDWLSHYSFILIMTNVWYKIIGIGSLRGRKVIQTMTYISL